MSTGTIPAVQPANRIQSWAPVAAVCLLLAACYAPVLWRLIQLWDQDPDMGYGFCVIPVAAFLAWRKRTELAAVRPDPSWWGLAVLSWGAAQMLVAEIAAELFLARTAFVISLAGAVLLLWGWRRLKILAFPIFLLLLMVPVPGILYTQLTLPLQLLASSAGASLVRLCGVAVERTGNIVIVTGHPLLIGEACSGIRSLLSLAFLALSYGAFTEKSNVVRWALAALTVPIALAANAVRVALSALLTAWKPELAEGFAHEASGWLIFLIAISLLLALHPLLQRAFGRRGIR